MHRFPTPTPPRLIVEYRAGSVAIDTVDGDETSVDLQPPVEGAVIEQRGDEIVVLMPRRDRGVFGRSSHPALTVTTPHGTALAITSGSAGIVARGRYSTTKVTTGSGDVTIGDIGDSARLRSGSGRLGIDAVAGDLEVGTGSGDIEIGAVAGSASVETGSGDVRIRRGGTAIDVKSGSGDVSIGSAPTDLRIRTASGDIAIDDVVAGAVRAKAASGDIHAGVRRGTAAWLDVRTISGRVSSDLESSGEPAADEERAHLQLETVSGDIELVRVGA